MSFAEKHAKYLAYLDKLKETMTEEEYRNRDIWQDLDFNFYD